MCNVTCLDDYKLHVSGDVDQITAAVPGGGCGTPTVLTTTPGVPSLIKFRIEWEGLTLFSFKGSSVMELVYMIIHCMF